MRLLGLAGLHVSLVLYIVFLFSVQLNVQETSGGAVAKLRLLLELRPEKLPSRDSVFKVAKVSGEFVIGGGMFTDYKALGRRGPAEDSKNTD